MGRQRTLDFCPTGICVRRRQRTQMGTHCQAGVAKRIRDAHTPIEVEQAVGGKGVGAGELLLSCWHHHPESVRPKYRGAVRTPRAQERKRRGGRAARGIGKETKGERLSYARGTGAVSEKWSGARFRHLPRLEILLKPHGDSEIRNRHGLCFEEGRDQERGAWVPEDMQDRSERAPESNKQKTSKRPGSCFLGSRGLAVSKTAQVQKTADVARTSCCLIANCLPKAF